MAIVHPSPLPVPPINRKVILIAVVLVMEHCEPIRRNHNRSHRADLRVYIHLLAGHRLSMPIPFIDL